MKCSVKDGEIKRLRIQLEQATASKKRREAQQDPNERFVSFAEVLAQSNQEPKQRIRRPQQKIVAEEESSSSEDNAEIVRRSTRARRPTRRFLEKDEAEDDDDDNSDS
jgi:hypothetical protein